MEEETKTTEEVKEEVNETVEEVKEEVKAEPVAEEVASVVEQPVVEQPAVDPVPVQPVKRSKKDIIGYNPETGEPIYKEIVPGEIPPKKSKKGLIIGIIIALVVIACVTIVLIFTLGKKSGKSDEEYQYIIDNYGDAVERAIYRYNDRNGVLPTFKNIKKNITYDDYEVSCDTIKINYDGSIYLANCSVDGKKIDKDITYGAKKEKPPVDDKIIIYKNEYQYGDSYFLYDEAKNTSKSSITDDTKTYAEYNCENEGCFGYTYNKDADVLILNDGSVLAYDLKSKKKTELKNINKDAPSLSTIINDKKEIIALLVRKDSSTSNYYNAALYNYKEQKYVTDFKYYNSGSYLNKNYLVLSSNSYEYVIDLDGKEIYKPEANNVVSYNNGYYIEKHGIASNTSPLKVLDENFKELITDFESYNAAVNDDGTITVTEIVKDENGYNTLANKYYIYDKTGKRLSESKEFDKLYLLVKDYAYVLNGNKITYVRVKDGKEIEITDMKDSYKVHTAISGWWNKENEDGLWIVIEDESVDHGVEGRGLEYYYVPKTGKIDVVKINDIGGYAKPVLYLYPEKETNINISFNHPEYLTTTYPKYNTSWNVKAMPNGDLYDANGKYYYGLYWEETGSTDVDFTTGYYVTKENAIDFLEEKLTTIGLNDRERNEFIMYWLPILEKNEKNLVYFELTEERDAFNKININPAPDSLLRLAIHVKKVNEKVDIQEQVLPHFDRKGFVAVEWGGVIH